MRQVVLVVCKASLQTLGQQTHLLAFLEKVFIRARHRHLLKVGVMRECCLYHWKKGRKFVRRKPIYPSFFFFNPVCLLSP